MTSSAASKPVTREARRRAALPPPVVVTLPVELARTVLAVVMDTASRERAEACGLDVRGRLVATEAAANKLAFAAECDKIAELVREGLGGRNGAMPG